MLPEQPYAVNGGIRESQETGDVIDVIFYYKPFYVINWLAFIESHKQKGKLKS